MALEGFKNRILGSVGLLKGKRKVDEESVKDLSRSLRRALLEADFNVRQTKEITENRKTFAKIAKNFGIASLH